MQFHIYKTETDKIEKQQQKKTVRMAQNVHI
jgi:hypothetical protein